jgi:hypothetical protein
MRMTRHLTPVTYGLVAKKFVRESFNTAKSCAKHAIKTKQTRTIKIRKKRLSLPVVLQRSTVLGAGALFAVRTMYLLGETWSSF